MVADGYRRGGTILEIDCSASEVVLAGGAGLGLKHGSHVDYNQQVKEFQGYGKGLGVYHSPVNTQAHFSNLLLPIAQKMGVEAETFANSNGVISEILS